MTKIDSINKAKVQIANSSLDYQRALNAMSIGHHAKARTACRRAAGFYISAFHLLIGYDKYGKSFLTQLKLVGEDESLNLDIREASSRLSSSVSQIEINSEEAIKNADIVIKHFQSLIDELIYD